MEDQKIRTIIYIDVSNIRHACLWSCGFNIDFVKLYKYLKTKYPNVEEIRYYEGISSDDIKKQKHFRFLNEEVGYTICSLERKGYIEPARYKTFKCKNCEVRNKVRVLPRTTKLKSNVDVYLASDMLECVAKSTEPVNVVLLSCDGDYVEAIKATLRISPNSRVTVLASPMTKVNNCLSMRLKQLSRELDRNNYKLVNINNVKDYISQPLQDSMNGD